MASVSCGPQDSGPDSDNLHLPCALGQIGAPDVRPSGRRRLLVPSRHVDGLAMHEHTGPLALAIAQHGFGERGLVPPL